MSTAADVDRLLTDHETAEILGVTTGTLATWRSSKRYDLPYVKVGRNVRYRQSDVMGWIESRTETCQG